MVNDISFAHCRILIKGIYLMVELDMIIETSEPEPALERGMIKPHLRTVDLNLLTVFDAVMQEQNITRADVYKRQVYRRAAGESPSAPAGPDPDRRQR